MSGVIGVRYRFTRSSETTCTVFATSSTSSIRLSGVSRVANTDDPPLLVQSVFPVALVSLLSASEMFWVSCTEPC